MHIPTMVFRGERQVLSSSTLMLIAEDVVRGLSGKEFIEFQQAFLSTGEIDFLEQAFERVPEEQRHGPGMTYRSATPNSDDLNIVGRIALYSVNDATLSSIALGLPSWWVEDIGDDLLAASQVEKHQKLMHAYRTGRPL